MKVKIGECDCDECGFTHCDVGLDKKGNPYAVCWGAECAGAPQYFSRGVKNRVRRILEIRKFRPLPGVDVPALREKYGLDAKAPAPQPAPAPAPAPAAKPAAKPAGTIFG